MALLRACFAVTCAHVLCSVQRLCLARSVLDSSCARRAGERRRWESSPLQTAPHSAAPLAPPPFPPLRRYAERLVITRPVTISSLPGAAVEVAWETPEPYQSTVECSGVAGEVVLRGLRVRHASPSIANNYAVRLAVRAYVCVCGGVGAGAGLWGGLVGRPVGGWREGRGPWIGGSSSRVCSAILLLLPMLGVPPGLLWMP